ncbi:MAG TPA: TIGR00725 family protein [Chloroflexota bacterium]|nr:TIGR00725 family protein [Chloroflexota bacterium]
MSEPAPRPRRRVVAVIGAGECEEDMAKLAYAVGKLVAEADAVLVTGGRGGVMAAASRGAGDAGGLVIGLLPGIDPHDADDAVEVAIPTGMGQLRNGLVVNSAGAVIAIGGEWGTLSEIGFSLKTGKPVIGLGTWELAKGGVSSEAIVRVSTAREAVDAALDRYVG